ncbi:MAG: hypothetical protein HC876_11500 [Chloroflexaceae bacterium]|nr:hypothetical protein [Chloroflexaceae bacterium]
MVWYLRVLLITASVVCPLLGEASIAAQSQPETPEVRVLAVDPANYPDEVTLRVMVSHPTSGILTDLPADAFQLRENDQTVQQVAVRESPDPLRVAIVADINAALELATFQALAAGTSTLLDALFPEYTAPNGPPHALLVTLLIPSDTDSEPHTYSIGTRAAAASAMVDLNQSRPSDETYLYRAIVAAARQQPDVLLVLSDGPDGREQDATPTQAIEQARAAGVAIHTIMYSLQPDAALVDLAGATGGQAHISTVMGQHFAPVVAPILDTPAPALYTLRYQPAPTADDQRPAPVELELMLTSTAGTAQTQLRYVPPPPLWDTSSVATVAAGTTAASGMVVDISNYPELVLAVRPANAAQRRLVPPLSANDITLASDTLQLTGKPLIEQIDQPTVAADVSQPVESIAVFIDLPDPDERMQSLLRSYLEAHTATGSQMAVFAVGASSPEWETFTADLGHLLNATVRNPSFFPADDTPHTATFQRALEAVVAHSNAAQHPAYLVLLTNRPLPPDVYQRSLVYARQHAVVIHTIALDAASTKSNVQALATATRGRLLVAPDRAQLAGLARQIVAERPDLYHITMQAASYADGQTHPLTVALRSATAPVQVAAVMAGPAAVSPLRIGLLIGGSLLVLLGFVLFGPLYRARPRPTRTSDPAEQSAFTDWIPGSYVPVQTPYPALPASAAYHREGTFGSPASSMSRRPDDTAYMAQRRSTTLQEFELRGRRLLQVRHGDQPLAAPDAHHQPDSSSFWNRPLQQ